MAVPSIKPQIAPERKSLTILGSTGSIGCNTIDLIGRCPEDYRIVALTAYNSTEMLAEQARRLRPELVVIGDERRYGDLQSALAGTGIEVAAGAQALIEAAGPVWRRPWRRSDAAPWSPWPTRRPWSAPANS
jgi:1-deoxy-D-xylulose-5-phosphate reductoisomerase